MNCRLNSLYLCVKDMDRAIAFYKGFFEKSPLIEDEIYSIFDLNGFRLGLFAYQKMGEDHLFGSNCLSSLEVDNLDILQNKIKNLEICFSLTKIKNNWVVEFVDSEGNHIELTAPVKMD